MYISLMFDAATTHHKYLKGSCRSTQEVPSCINRLVGFFCKWLSSVCQLPMATLSPVEIDTGRKVTSCSHVFCTHLIFLFRSTIYAIPTKSGSFQFVFDFVFTGGFGFLASLISFVLARLKRFESLATDRDSLFVFTAFGLPPSQFSQMALDLQKTRKCRHKWLATD